jgi:membrane protein
MLCTAPLLIAFSAVSERATGRSTGTVLTGYLGLIRPAGSDVARLFVSSTRVSNADIVAGLALALLFATGVAATQQRGFELIWGQARAGLASAGRQLAWVAGLCLYLVLALYAGRAGYRVGAHLHAGRPASPFMHLGVSLLFFWWSQHLLLGGRVGWRQLLPGATAMAIGMTVLVVLSGPIMSGEIVTQVADYGLIGATFVLSVWLVVLSAVVFGGALIGALVVERHEQGAGSGVGALHPVGPDDARAGVGPCRDAGSSLPGS